VLYVGTGSDAITTFSIGAGLVKTTDGGESWSLPLLADASFTSVTAISVHPLNAEDLLIGNNAGGYRSTDGGATWAKVISDLGIVSDFVRDPGNPQVVYASTWNRKRCRGR